MVAALAALGLFLGGAPAGSYEAGVAEAGGPVGPAYVTAPPAAHTGGFGEPTCRACHFDHPLNEAGGALEVRGLPETVDSGSGPVELTVELARTGMARAGVELAVRYADGSRKGAQAGRLEVEGDRLELETAPRDSSEIVYARHTEAGSQLSAPDTARWRLRWLPPEMPTGAVVVHVAANAANDDFSEFGDRIYADSVVVRAPGSR